MSRKKNAFIEAFYHNRFKDNLFVVKAGGEIIEDDKALANLLANIRRLTLDGINILLVYGGGTATDKALKARGIEPKKHNGRRITDKETLGVMKEIMGGAMSLRVLEAMAAAGLEGLNFNAVPTEWMQVEFRPKKPVDFGFVGDIHDVRQRAVMRLFRVTNFVAVTCLASTADGHVLNINADTIATELAVGTKAHKLIFLSNVDGVQIKGKTAGTLTDKDIPALIRDGTVTGGMQVKMENCLRALQSGVRRIHLLSGFSKDALLKEIYEPVGPGTMIMRENEKKRYMTEIKAGGR